MLLHSTKTVIFPWVSLAGGSLVLSVHLFQTSILRMLAIQVSMWWRFGVMVTHWS